jgi:hypothetical protein
MKTSLESSKEEILKLFPHKLDNLDVYLPLNSEDDLMIIFYKKNTYDPNRN